MRLSSLLVVGLLASTGCKQYYDTDSACADTVSNSGKLTALERDSLSRINCYRRMAGIARVGANPTVQLAADNEISYVEQNPDYDQLLGEYGPVYWLTQQSELPGYTGATVYDRLTNPPDLGGAGYQFYSLESESYWEYIFVEIAPTQEQLKSGVDAIDELMRFPEFRQVALQPSWVDGAFAEGDLTQKWFTNGGYFGSAGGATGTESGGGTGTGTGAGTTVDPSLAPYGKVYYMIVVYHAPHYEHAATPVLLPREDQTDVPLYGWSQNRNVLQGDGTYAPTQLSYPISLLMGAIDPANYSAIDQNQYNAQITAASIVGPDGLPLETHVVHPGDDPIDSWPSGHLLRTTLAIFARHPFEPSSHYDVFADYTTPAGQYTLKYGFNTRNDDPGVDPTLGLTQATTGVTQRRSADDDLPGPRMVWGSQHGVLNPPDQP